MAQSCKAVLAGPQSFPHPLIDLLGDLLFRWHIGHAEVLDVGALLLVYKAAIFVGTSNAASSVIWLDEASCGSLFGSSGGIAVVKDLAVTAIVILWAVSGRGRCAKLSSFGYLWIGPRRGYCILGSRAVLVLLVAFGISARGYPVPSPV